MNPTRDLLQSLAAKLYSLPEYDFRRIYSDKNILTNPHKHTPATAG